MTTRRRAEMTAWQKRLVAELKALAEENADDVKISRQPKLQNDRDVELRIRLRTAAIPRLTSGLDLLDHEEFILRLPSAPFRPPSVAVDHVRFLGHPHVLMGQHPCVYLDPSREWHPQSGMGGFLNRLWDWLTDAAGGKFDPATAMYHAVGGVLHLTDGTPTIVVREAGPVRARQVATLITRTEQRCDLTYTTGREGLKAPVFTLATDMPFGAATTFADLLKLLDDPYLEASGGRPPRVAPQSPAFLTTLLTSAVRNPRDTHQYFVLAVPHPAGGPSHLLCGRLPTDTANALRAIAGRYGTTINLDPAEIKTDIPIEWCAVSDERQAVTTRRDDTRPVNGFQDKSVFIWGCGGLGSWVAEFIMRAGAGEIALCDPARITGGLLVRQNYVEDDIGQSKAHALQSRLEAICDTTAVKVASDPPDESTLLATDLVLDATISHAVSQ